MAFDDRANISEEHSRLDHLHSTIKAFPGGFRNANRIHVYFGPVSDVVGLVEITVKTAMIERHVDIDDVSIQENTVVWNPMADDLVGRSADRLRKMEVIKG